MKLVLDTSALIYLAERRASAAVEELAEHRLYVPSAVLRELQLLAARSRKARTALGILAVLRAEVVELEGPADRAVVEAAKALGAGVVTGDGALAERCRALGIPVAKFHDGRLAVS